MLLFPEVKAWEETHDRLPAFGHWQPLKGSCGFADRIEAVGPELGADDVPPALPLDLIAVHHRPHHRELLLSALGAVEVGLLDRVLQARVHLLIKPELALCLDSPADVDANLSTGVLLFGEYPIEQFLEGDGGQGHVLYLFEVLKNHLCIDSDLQSSKPDP